MKGEILSRKDPIIELLVEGTGMGFEIIASTSLLAECQEHQKGEAIIYHHRTEASESLFGFTNREEREVFLQLLKVNGIGGKSALNLLSLGIERLQRAIVFEEEATLSSVPGIGKKTAQKIILELKGSIEWKTPVKDKDTASEIDIPREKNLIELASALISM